jgi:probable rRNA maturation factor
MPSPRHTIDIEITAATARRITALWLRRIAQRTLTLEKVSGPQELGLLLTTDARIRSLNRQYRRKDAVTDVLSFALAESDGDFAPSPEGPSTLGQVVVSYPRAVRQAREYGHSTEREVAFLFIHGLLHLLGYDHQRRADERRMLERQEAILASLGITRAP